MTLAALRKLAELNRRRYEAILADLAPWEHAAGSYGADAVSYPMRRASWRILKLAGVLGDAL